MIQSSNNARLKRARALLQYSKRRRTEHSFVLEGQRLIADVVQTGANPDYVLHRPDVAVDELLARNITCLAVEPTLLDGLSDTQTPQGILAVFPWPDLPHPEQPGLTLILDGVSDPGNVGTMLRTAVSAGVELAVLAPGTVDPFNPKVVRGAMGAHFRVPVRRWEWERIHRLEVPLVVADATGDRTIYEMTWQKPLAIVIGSEAHGPSQQAVRHGSQIVRVPMVAGESLNAAIAAAVILYEIYRQSH